MNSLVIFSAKVQYNRIRISEGTATWILSNQFPIVLALLTQIVWKLVAMSGISKHSHGWVFFKFYCSEVVVHYHLITEAITPSVCADWSIEHFYKPSPSWAVISGLSPCSQTSYILLLSLSIHTFMHQYVALTCFLCLPFCTSKTYLDLNSQHLCSSFGRWQCQTGCDKGVEDLQEGILPAIQI